MKLVEDWWSSTSLNPHMHPTIAKASFPLPLGYRLGLVEGRDLPQLTRLLLACFSPDQPMAFPGVLL